MKTKWKAVLYSALGFAIISGAWIELNSTQGPASAQQANGSMGTPSRTTTPPTEISTPPSYKDGVYAASKTVPWGPVTITITVKDGKWVSVERTQWPGTAPSGFAADKLVAQAMAAQSANIDGVSGATFTSGAFRDDLQNIVAQSQS